MNNCKVKCLIVLFNLIFVIFKWTFIFILFYIYFFYIYFTYFILIWIILFYSI